MRVALHVVWHQIAPSWFPDYVLCLPRYIISAAPLIALRLTLEFAAAYTQNLFIHRQISKLLDMQELSPTTRVHIVHVLSNAARDFASSRQAMGQRFVLQQAQHVLADVLWARNEAGGSAPADETAIWRQLVEGVLTLV